MRPVTLQPGFTMPDFEDLLRSRRFAVVDCYTIVNKDGVYMRVATGQHNVVIQNSVNGEVGEVEYRVDRLKVSGLMLNIGIGAEVDEQDLQLDYSMTETYLGQPFAAALLSGRFDGGTVRRDRYFAEDWQSPWVGGVPMFTGRTSSPDNVGRSSATLTVKSESVLLDLPMPKNVFSAQCQHIIFDPGCTLVKALYATPGMVGVGATATVIPWSGGTSSFTGGTVQVEDGAGVVTIRTIKEYSGGAMVLYEPLPAAPEAGINFVAFPGCNRSKARCDELGNTVNWRAYPFVPVPETAY